MFIGPASGYKVRVRSVLLSSLLALGLVACSDLSHLQKEAIRGGPLPRILDPGDTRRVAKAWRKAGFAGQVQEFRVESNRSGLTKLIDAYEIRTRVHRQDGAVGIPVLIDTAPPPGVSIQIAPHAHLLTLQPATLVARQVGPDELRLSLHDPRGSATLDGRPLASANSLLSDYIIREQEEGLLNLRGLLTPTEYSYRRGFYLHTPYDPDKIPVIFIHGLASSPFTFRDMAVRLQADPLLWNRYQFWFYLYPTGDPWLVSAARFREDLGSLVAAVDPGKDDRHIRNMVVVAHSMGGLITRASTSHHSRALYRRYFNQPLQDLNLEVGQKEEIESLLLYRPIPWPKRIVFLSTPHRGSQLAGGPLNWMALQLIRLPGRVIGGTLNVVQALAAFQPASLTRAAHQLLREGEVSVTQLDADSPALQALQEMPMRKDVRLHSVVADLGGPDLFLGTDGVVPYESAHLPGAESEVVIQSGHSMGGDRAAIREVTRILRLHLQGR